MVKKSRKAELEALGIVDLESLCEEAGIDVTRNTMPQMIDRLLESEGQTSEPEPEPEPEPAEPTEPEA